MEFGETLFVYWWYDGQRMEWEQTKDKLKLMIEDIRWTWRQTKPGQSELTSNDKDKLRSEHIVSYYHQSFTVVVVAVAK